MKTVILVAIMSGRNTPKDALYIDNDNNGLDSTLRPVVDREGTESSLHASTEGVGVGAMGDGTGISGDGYGWLRFANDHPTASYNIGSSVHVANGGHNPILMAGWNCRYVNEKPHDPTEHAWYTMFEANYDSGTFNACEWYLEYVDPGLENLRRPIMSTVGRDNHEVVNQFTGDCLFYNNTRDTENFTISEDGSGVVVKRGSVHIDSPAGSVILTALNTAGNSSLELIKINTDDRVFIPHNLLVMSTNKWLPGINVLGAAEQNHDMVHLADVGGNVLSRFDRDGCFMTRKTSEPVDDDIAVSEVALWFDDTIGAAKLKIKGKSADGTVVTGEVALT